MSELAIPEPSGVIGLEDFGVADEQIPRLKILHAEALFEDSLSKETFEVLSGVPLGMIRQRVLFHEEIDKFDGPLCRSSNFTHGQPWRVNFPWAQSGFTEDDLSGDTLSCEKCKLKDWGSHPSRDTPYCSEQMVVPFMREFDDGTSSAVLTTFQKSGIKPVKSYMSRFVQREEPLFMHHATITLIPAKRGSVTYSVPEIVIGELTDLADHPAYGQTFTNIKAFLHSRGGSEPAKELPKGAAPSDVALEEDPF